MKAQFFPAFFLTGALGRASDALRGLVTSRGETVGSISGELLAPIFTGGALTANYYAARARAERAALTYRRTVLVGLREISDTLAPLSGCQDGARGAAQEARATR